MEKGIGNSRKREGRLKNYKEKDKKGKESSHEENVKVAEPCMVVINKSKQIIKKTKTDCCFEHMKGKGWKVHQA